MHAPTLTRSLVRVHKQDHDADQRPLYFRLINRLFRYTQPYAVKRNLLIVLVIIRAIQLPALTGLLTAVIEGPIQGSDPRPVFVGAGCFAARAF